MPTEIVIDLKGCGDSEKALRKIAEALKFADWFGVNWDALNESISCLHENGALKEGIGPYKFPLKLVFLNVKEFKNCVGLLGKKQYHILVEVLEDAKKRYEKDGLKFDFELTD